MEQQQEQTEWDSVNRLLQHQGFKPVRFADPVENKNLSDLVLLEKKTAGEIRVMLRTMLTDSERRQALITELIQANNQLKEDAEDQRSQAAGRSQRVSELEGALEEVKAKVQELEDQYINSTAQQHSQLQQLQQEKSTLQGCCQTLEVELRKEKEAVGQLQKKLYFTVKEEEMRASRRAQAFQIISKRSAWQQQPIGQQQVEDVIDFYESQMIQLLDEIRSHRGAVEESQGSDDGKEGSKDVTATFKTILKCYHDQLKESRAQTDALQRSAQMLQQELETRPTKKELRNYKYQIRYFDRLIKQSNLRREMLSQTSEGDGSAEIRNLEENTDARAKETTLRLQYHHLLSEISAILTNPRAPQPLRRQRPTNGGSEMAEFQDVLPTLAMWSEQLDSLKDLHRSLNKLSSTLAPWRPVDSRGPADSGTVEDLMMLVDSLQEELFSDEEQVLRSPTKHTLESMVSHFQKLFDVPSLRGVYPRMNELYAKLGEMSNVMTNLRDVLTLGDRASPSEVVNEVARVTAFTDDTIRFHLQHLLGDEDINSIILKVKEHDEFFPAFHLLVQHLLQTLEVSCLEDIVPALHSLQLRAQ